MGRGEGTDSEVGTITSKLGSTIKRALGPTATNRHLIS